jgi:hypothetical protein
MNIPTLKYTLIVSLFILSVTAQSQDKKNETATGTQSANITEEIEVIRPYKPVLADAVKIRRNPDMNSTKPFKPVLSYSVIDKKLNLNSNIKELQAQKMEDERLPVLSNNYLKVGAGNFNTAQAEAYFNSGRDAALQTGAYFKHLSQQGNLEKQQFSNQELSIFGRSVADSYSISGNLSYDRRSTFFYGFAPASSAPIDMSKQRFSTIAAEAEIMNNYAQSSPFNYAASINAYQFSTIEDAQESSILLKGYVNKEISLFNVGLNASADFTSTKDAAYNLGNNILRANPYVNLKGKGYELILGANIVQEFGAKNRLNIFPSVSAELPVIPEYAVVFAGVNGDVLKTSVRDLALENPFLNKDLSIKNSLESINLQAGVKGNVGAEFGYKIMGYFKNIDDMQLMVNNQTIVNRFDVIYDNGTSTIFGLEGELNVKASDVFSIGGKAQIFKYDLANQTHAWFKPTVRLISNASAQVNQKLFLDTELLLQGETYARINTAGSGFSSSTLKGFIDLSVGAEYKVHNKIGVYLRANNLTGQSYQRYLYYPKMGLTLLGGANYSF